MREAGLVRVQVRPVAGATLGRPHPLTLDYAIGSAAGAVEAGLATADEAERWLAGVRQTIASRE